jgi:hypothetical protein
VLYGTKPNERAKEHAKTLAKPWGSQLRRGQ